MMSGDDAEAGSDGGAAERHDRTAAVGRHAVAGVRDVDLVLLDQMLPEVQQLANAVMGVLDEEALHQLLDTLAALTETIENAPQNLPPPAPRRTPGRLRRK